MRKSIFSNTPEKDARSKVLKELNEALNIRKNTDEIGEKIVEPLPNKIKAKK